MPIPRENPVEWTFVIVLAMFFAGVDAGAYLTAAIMDLSGRAKSRAAHAAHLVAFPFGVLTLILLTVDLGRPERFWHMIFQSDRLPLLLFKSWSPISFGTWLISIFALVTFVAFVSSLMTVRRWRGPAWLHADPLKIVLAVVGGLLAIGVGSYQGLLLQATNFPGWRDTAWLGAQYIALAALTGVAAVMLARPLVPGPDTPDERADVVQLGTFMWSLAILWVATTLIFLGLSLSGLRFFFHGLWLALFVLGAVFLVLPVVFGLRPRSGGVVPLVAGLVLVGGLLVRAALVMGPQTV